MSAAAVIEVEGLSKSYRLFQRPWEPLLQGVPLIRRRAIAGRTSAFRALQDVSFSIQRGEVVGILGRNGSGKSTLLQIIAGTLRPSAGQVKVRGRVAALLELGAGFNPEFTGMDNLRLSAALHGFGGRETDERIEQILAFADIGDYIHRPVKTYSSGMYVRLAFAVASSADPDVLIVDEALAVGDVKFQTRCFRRFEELVRKGTTVLLVTHSTEQVTRHCSRALLIDNGRLVDDGAPRDVANRYLDMMLGSRAGVTEGGALARSPVADAGAGVLEQRAGYCSTEYRWGAGGVALFDVELRSAEGGVHRARFTAGDHVELWVRARFERPVDEPIYGFFVKTPDGVTVYGNSTANLLREQDSARAGESRTVVFPFTMNLGMGSYVLSLGVSERRSGEVVALDRRYDVLQFEVLVRDGAVGVADLQAGCRVVKE